MRRVQAIATVALFFVFAALPLAIQFASPPASGAWENRMLAPAPVWPMHWRDIAPFTRATTAWIDDHFGLRRAFVELNNTVRFTVFGESANPQLAFGAGRRLFFISHEAVAPTQLVDFLCAGGGNPAGMRTLAGGLAGFMDDAAKRAARTLYVLVPTKTIVQADLLPQWLQARCVGGVPAVPAILAALHASRPDVADRVVYPLDRMRALGADAYPAPNFHWEGDAPRLIATDVAQRFGRMLIAPLPMQRERHVADLQNMLPGVRLRFVADEPDFAAAGIAACDCISALGTAGPVLSDVSRFVRPGARAPRLLLLSDSFGKAIAPWFAAYYAEVWHISLSHVGRLSAAQVVALRRTLFDTYQPDDVLFVFHDFSAAYINDLLRRSFWEIGP